MNSFIWDLFVGETDERWHWKRKSYAHTRIPSMVLYATQENRNNRNNCHKLCPNHMENPIAKGMALCVYVYWCVRLCASAACVSALTQAQTKYTIIFLLMPKPNETTFRVIYRWAHQIHWFMNMVEQAREGSARARTPERERTRWWLFPSFRKTFHT